MNVDWEKLSKTVRHIHNVQDAGVLLGQRLIERGEHDIGRVLIANVHKHDYSKFFGMEFDYLNTDPAANTPEALLLKTAISQHNRTNAHHPEYWGGITNMPRVYLAEMVCDWKARSSEMGRSLMEWIEGPAMQRYQFTKNDAVYEKIMYFVNLLLDKPFKPVAT